ncbi:OmpA family protein [Pseudomonas chlororaphis]|uniref:OmpA family protein n=1 Tax=Pseudomonas chlororaphis TaxID=587753 RepID=UPI001925C835|nr:OmpA family protein [Pseudomonas chlororaphis]QQX57079.1 OmpA family protein [Pseudomonas chlororaphis subsp. aurantiaca]QQX57081.1 OmpA family protein [Pseudomonas chlororaphis subsp. aurantiaca]
MKTIKPRLLAIVLVGAGVFTLNASAAISEKAFGPQYEPVAAISPSQAQVVYYRDAANNQRPDAAHVYIDGEFHTGLLPGGYTRFCVVPGRHALDAVIGDAPLYRGKTELKSVARLEGGKTYFVRVLGDTSNMSSGGVSRKEAEQQLQHTRLQVHALSRASAVQACDLQAKPSAPTYKDYMLSGDVLFAFGTSGREDITAAGRRAIAELIVQLHREHKKLERILVIGHTDPIGSQAANYTLGQRRASTVRQLLMDGGIPLHALRASSVGSRELLVSDCYGDRQEQIACNAPNRRVIVRVDVSSSEN